MNFSSLQSSVQKFGMNQALKYLEKDPETNIPKLMNLVDKVMPEGWYGSQRKVIREQIDEKGVWYDYILSCMIWMQMFGRLYLKTLFLMRL